MRAPITSQYFSAKWQVEAKQLRIFGDPEFRQLLATKVSWVITQKVVVDMVLF
jgi:hypothetical protein